MRKTLTTVATLATLLAPLFATPAFSEDGEPYDSETVVFAQRRLTMAKGLIRPELAFFVGKEGKGSDTIVGLAIKVDWTPIDKLQVGARGAPEISPTTAAGDPELYVRYQLLEGMFQLAVQGSYTFTDPSPGIVALGVPMSIDLNPAAKLELEPEFLIDLPQSGEDTVFGVALPLELDISLTRALYIAIRTGLEVRDLSDTETLAIPLGLEVGYSLKGKEETAFIDIFLRADFEAFLLPNAPAGTDTVHADFWTIALGARAHFALGDD